MSDGDEPPPPLDPSVIPINRTFLARGGNHDTAHEEHRRQEAVRLKLAGLSYREIARRLGYAGPQPVQRLVVRSLADAGKENRHELLDIENARLDRQLAAIWQAVIQGDIGAGHLALRIAERRAKMNGLDAPTQVAVTPGSQEVLEWVQQVLALTRDEDTGPSDVVEADVVDWGDDDG